jgi:hypothetical protein
MEPAVTGHCAALFALLVGLTFVILALAALIVAGWKRFRLGSHLLRECCGDYALAWAELKELREKNRLDTARLWQAMRIAALRRAFLGDEP